MRSSCSPHVIERAVDLLPKVRWAVGRPLGMPSRAAAQPRCKCNHTPCAPQGRHFLYVALCSRSCGQGRGVNKNARCQWLGWPTGPVFKQCVPSIRLPVASNDTIAPVPKHRRNCPHLQTRRRTAPSPTTKSCLAKLSGQKFKVEMTDA